MFKKTLLACAIWGVCAASTASAQEVQRMPSTTALQAVTATTTVAPAKTVFVLVDLTGSFVDHMLAGDFIDRSIKRVMREVQANVGSHSLVRVGIIGHSNRDVTSDAAGGTYEHLLAKEWSVGGRYTKEKVASGVRRWLDDIAADLRSGKIKKQENTAVIMAMDRASELIRKANQPCAVIAISDLDDTELGLPLPAPYRPNLLKGCQVYGIGAGITLREGTKAERQLRKAWEGYFQAAGVDVASDFYWIPNP